jgi:hypothetical protein
MSAEGGGAAGRDRSKRPVLDRRQPMRLTIHVAARPDDVCELEARTGD